MREGGYSWGSSKSSRMMKLSVRAGQEGKADMIISDCLPPCLPDLWHL